MAGVNCALLLMGQVFLALFAMWRVAVIDVRQSEIDLTWLLVLIVSTLSAPLMTGSMWAVPYALAVGVTTAVAAALVVWLFSGPLGEGDIWLMGAVGVIGGPTLLLPLMLVLVIFAAGTSAAYSHARGRRLFKSRFPLALPAMAAATPFLLVQFAAAFWPNSVAAELAQFDMISLMLIAH